jgi:hypothetical protein
MDPSRLPYRATPTPASSSHFSAWRSQNSLPFDLVSAGGNIMNELYQVCETLRRASIDGPLFVDTDSVLP